MLRWASDVAATLAEAFELAVGLEGAHALEAAGPTWIEGPDDLWLRARASLPLMFDSVLRLDVEARVGLRRDDWWLVTALELRASSATTLALGTAVFGGNALDLGLGALYDTADEVWIRGARTF